jgi:hypothetical protein
MIKHIAIFAFISLLVSGTVAQGRDVCEKSIPDSLQKALSEKYPSYRIALSGDQCTEDDKDWNKLYCNSNRCQTVASGDFDGNKLKDFALYLVKKGSAAPALVVALRSGAKWIITELPQWNETILGCYVEPAKPGLYERTMSSELNTDDPSEREKIVTKRTSFVAGRVESTGVLYVHDNGKWLHVWVSD